MATTSPEELQAVAAVKLGSHPLRIRILSHINTHGAASPNEMAKEFEESLPLVSYHVRILREGDAVKLVRTTPRRGAIEHHYKITPYGQRVRQRFGPIPRALADLRGVNLVLGCQQKGCAAQFAITLSDGEVDPGYALSALDLVTHIAEEWPAEWEFVLTPTGYELRCPEHMGLVR